jgi:SulP family sulfate permease
LEQKASNWPYQRGRHFVYNLNKVIELQHLSPDCITLLKNAEAVIKVNVIEDPTYKVVS